MFKVGDKVVCKNFPRKVNHIIVKYDSNITINKSYVIVGMGEEITNKYGIMDLRMLKIIGEKGDECWYYSDYFYNKKELRKMKIEKICSKLEIK